MMMCPSPSDLVFSVDIDAPIRTVWDAVTRTGEVSPPVFNCVLHSTLEPGARMDYTDAAGKHCFMFGELIEIEPPTRLVYSFVFGLYDDPPSRVEWELTELTSERTRVTVRHSGLPEKCKTRRDVSGGWPTILRRHKQLIESGKLPLKDRAQLGLMGAMSFLLPKKSLKVNTDQRSAALPTEPACSDESL